MMAFCASGRVLDYMHEPVPIELPLLHPNQTRLTHIACGRAHTVIATDNEGGNSPCLSVAVYSLLALFACFFVFVQKRYSMNDEQLRRQHHSKAERMCLLLPYTSIVP